jgi:hypothetical protein
MMFASLLADRHRHRHDQGHDQTRWQRVAQPRWFVPPLSHRGNGPGVDVFTHTAKKTEVLHVAALIDENLRDLDPAEAGNIDPGKIR